MSIAPTDADVWGLEIRLGKALAHNDFGSAAYLRAEISKIKSLGYRRGGERRFSQLDLIDLKIARAYLAGQSDNARFFIGQRAKQSLIDIQNRRS
ncbi:hypothetical protein [Bradyrhizobium sp. USDA 377]